MRIPLSLALLFLLVACDGSGSGAPSTIGAPAVVTPQTRDQLLLRVPRRGGPGRISAYSRLDSLIWTSAEPMPAVSRTLAFDQDAGTLAYVDTRSIPRFLDLRTGITTQGAPALRSVASRDAWNVYGVATDGQVVRATPAAQGAEGWRYKPPTRASAVFPQSDGSILVVSERPNAMAVWRLFPPDREIVDSAMLPNGGDSIPTQVGDRLYLAVDSGLVGVRGRGRTLQYVEPVEIEQEIISIIATPSGDRFFVATDSSNVIRIVNPYRDEIAGEIQLPGQPSVLRMDAYGRALIVRPVKGDSAWVVALGTDRVIGTINTTWRSDLPVVAPDGSILAVTGRDVVFLHGTTLEQTRTVRLGGDDFWHFFEWGGFRPRAAGIDEPVSFEAIGIPDSTTFRVDSITGDTLPPLPGGTPPPPTVPLPTQDTTRPPTVLPPLPPPPPAGFMVSFASVLDQGRAEQMAREIRIEGRTPRVISAVVDGIVLYRVVVGPFQTRNEADRIGRASGRQYWLLEVVP